LAAFDVTPEVLTAELLLSFFRSFVADKGMPHKKSVGLF
jgi:hypothetical protein